MTIKDGQGSIEMSEAELKHAEDLVSPTAAGAYPTLLATADKTGALIPGAGETVVGPTGAAATSAGNGDDEFTNILRQSVQAKVEGYNPEETGEETEFSKGEKISWFQMVSRYATCCDMTLMYSGVFCSIVFGASMPGFCLAFGGMIDGIGGALK